MEGEEGEVEEGGNGDQDGDSGNEVTDQLAVSEVFPGQEAPVVLGQQVETEEAGVDPDILHTERGNFVKTFRTFFSLPEGRGHEEG